MHNFWKNVSFQAVVENKKDNSSISIILNLNNFHQFKNYFFIGI